MKVLEYLWELPQNLLGLLIIKVMKAEKKEKFGLEFYSCSLFNSGVSLGKYIIFDSNYFVDKTVLNHEYGHSLQSITLGWLYLLVIGLPSIMGNVYDRIFHKKWDKAKRVRWYYKLPWENSADILGGVDRFGN